MEKYAIRDVWVNIFQCSIISPFLYGLDIRNDCLCNYLQGSIIDASQKVSSQMAKQKAPNARRVIVEQ
jgi:hypothetical protein